VFLSSYFLWHSLISLQREQPVVYVWIDHIQIHKRLWLPPRRAHNATVKTSVERPIRQLMEAIILAHYHFADPPAVW